MARNSILLILITSILCVSSLPAKAQPKIEWLPEGTLQNWSRKWIHAAVGDEGMDWIKKGRATVGYVDLDPETETFDVEIIVAWAAPGYCGSGGCSLHVYKHTIDNKYTLILGVLYGNLEQISVGKKITKGMYDILIYDYWYIWDGSRYVLKDSPQVSEIKDSALSESNDLEKAKTLNRQVIQLYRQGHYAEAIPLAKDVLAIYQKALGPDHPDVAASLNTLAFCYYSLGDYVKAVPLFKHSLAILEKALGPDHLDVATNLNNLAVLYDSMGDHAKAEPLFKRSLAILEKALGPDHP
jgi:tetratricopeptide (TPR) repeat protein